LGITAFVLLVLLLTKVVVEPWIGRKIQASLSEIPGDYQLKIEKVRVSILRSGVELEQITLQSIQENDGQPGLSGEIESVKFKGIHRMKALFRKDIDIREVDVFNSRINGKFAFPEKTASAKLSPLNIRIENLFFDRLVVDVKSAASAQTYSLKDGVFKVNLKLLYQGLGLAIINKQTGETGAIIEQVKSVIANIIVMESNPMPGEEVRPGIIDYDRDPDKFLFNYVVKALTSGLKSTVTKAKSPRK